MVKLKAKLSYQKHMENSFIVKASQLKEKAQYTRGIKKEGNQKTTARTRVSDDKKIHARAQKTKKLFDNTHGFSDVSSTSFLAPRFPDCSF